MTEQNDGLAKLALAEAIIKAAREMTNPRGGAHGAPNLRTECDDRLRQMYEESGTDRQRVLVNGEQVGTLSARVSKPVQVNQLDVLDFDALRAWLKGEDGAEYLDQIIAKAVPEVMELCMADGVVPDGCAMVRGTSSPLAMASSMARWFSIPFTTLKPPNSTAQITAAAAICLYLWATAKSSETRSISCS